jgi:HD-GYP domain-containing protein (c-di-GMP phosphodiesterase class II)
MVSSRVYRPARSIEGALDEIRRSSGTQFCPSSVAAFERALAAGALVGVLASLRESAAA